MMVLFVRCTDFNSRSRTGSDFKCLSTFAGCSVFQFTLPHRERPADGIIDMFKIIISIHAPAQGATGRALYAFIDMNDFNSRSRTGSDLHMLCWCHLAVCDFNSRSRTGSDLLTTAVWLHKVISIHAPAQGATPARCSIRDEHLGFQFTLPHRERPDLRKGICPYRHFNSRSRTGSDEAYSTFAGRTRYFNSRSRTGSDCLHFMLRITVTRFQFTLPHRERLL